MSVLELKSGHGILSQQLTEFTQHLHRSCTGIVREIVERSHREDLANPDGEQQDLKRMVEEAAQWNKLSTILLDQLNKEDKPSSVSGNKKEERETEKTSVDDVKKAEAKKDYGSKEGDHQQQAVDGIGRSEEQALVKPSTAGSSSREAVAAPPGPASEGLNEKPSSAPPALSRELPEHMSVLGPDDNIHPKSLKQAINETKMSPRASPAQLGLPTEDAIPEGRGPLAKDVEKLIISLDEKTKALEEQKELLEKERERANVAEQDLAVTAAKVTGLEAELEQLKAGSGDKSSRLTSSRSRGSRRASKDVKKR